MKGIHHRPAKPPRLSWALGRQTLSPKLRIQLRYRAGDQSKTNKLKHVPHPSISVPKPDAAAVTPKGYGPEAQEFIQWRAACPVDLL